MTPVGKGLHKDAAIASQTENQSILSPEVREPTLSGGEPFGYDADDREPQSMLWARRTCMASERGIPSCKSL
jgi:hypothetical protein